jgi:glycosyltransferase involved in cell wall biosynthesis
MRVLISTGTFPLREGDGLPAFVHSLARHLGHLCEVSVLAPGAPGALAHERWDDVEIERFSYFLPRSAQRLAYGSGMAPNLRRSWLARIQPPGFWYAQVRALRRLLSRGRFDVVNSHWLVPQGLSAAWVRGISGFPHVATVHGGDAYLLARAPGGRRLASYVIDRSDSVIAVAGSVRDALDSALGHASGAELLPMGVDLGRFEPGHGPEPRPFPGGYLLFVGRLAPNKGVADLLQALPTVRAQHPGLGLVVVGDGVEAHALRAQSASLGLSGAVRFEGATDSPGVSRWLRGCRVAVLPSRRSSDWAEGLPVSMLEALATGARVVATATGGIPELLRHGENGWLCRDRDPADLADKLLLALADAHESQVPRLARESALPFAWPRVAARTHAIFAEVSGRRAPEA